MMGITGIFTRSTRRRESPHALTLVELLVVMGVIVIVGGILGVSLRHARSQGSDARSLANLRTGLQMFGMWSDDRKGEHLNYERDPRRYDFRVGTGARGEQVVLEWHSQAIHQNWAYSWAWTTQEPPRFGGFRYCWPYLTEPRAWASPLHDYYLHHPRSFREEFRPTFRHEVAFPSAKVMLAARAASSPSDLPSTVFVSGFSDGSASLLKPEDALEQLADPYQMGSLNRHLLGNGTVGGLHGRDR